MPEPSPTTPDVAGVMRTPTGEIKDQSPTLTQPTTETSQPAEPPKPSTTPSSETKAETKADGKEAKESGKSLINEKSEGREGAPEKYEDFKVPEGFTLDPEIAGEASALFKKHDLSQAGAQELVDFYIAKTKEAFEAPFNAYNDTRQKWRDEVNGDRDIGGSKLNATRASIGRLIDSTGELGQAFRDAMDHTGAGDNPAVVKFLNALAKRLTEGGAVRGNGPSPVGQERPGEGRPSPAQAIYPHLPSNR